MVKKMTIIYLIFVISAILAVGGVFLYSRYFNLPVNQDKSPLVNTTKINVNQPVNNQKPIILKLIVDIIPAAKTDCIDGSDTACWSTYNNKEFGMKFKFPSKWTIRRNEIKGQDRNFLEIDFDTGIKMIKNNEPLVVFLSARSTLNSERTDYNSYYKESLQRIIDPNFRINLDNGGVAVFDACNAYSCWLIKLDKTIFNFDYDLQIPNWIGDDTEPIELYVTINDLNKINKMFRQMVKTVDSL